MAGGFFNMAFQIVFENSLHTLIRSSQQVATSQFN
jgi:hypothetical protein